MSAVNVTRATEAAEREALQQCGYVTLRSVRSRVSMDWRTRCRRDRRPFVELQLRGKKARLTVEMECTGRVLTDEAAERFRALIGACRHPYAGSSEVTLFASGLATDEAPGVVAAVVEMLRDPAATRPDPVSVWRDVARALATATSAQEYR